MIEYLAYNLPLAVFWLILVVAYYACIALGSGIKRRLVKAEGTTTSRSRWPRARSSFWPP